MKVISMINDALNTVAPRHVITTVTPPQPQGPVMIINVQADDLIRVRTLLLRTFKDGADLTWVLDVMIDTHPLVAREVILASLLGEVMLNRAAGSLRHYSETWVALAPRAL